MINVYCGFDKREAIGFSVFTSSLIEHASQPVAIIPLANMGQQYGTTAFTCSRFLIPWLQDFKGVAIFVDACDMLMRTDILELAALADLSFAVQVVKHRDYVSRHKNKFIGTEMEVSQSNYRRKNWASVMIINCAHNAWSCMTPELISECQPIELLGFNFLQDFEIGGLPDRWNRLVDEGQLSRDAAILHWSSGMPGFKYYSRAPGAEYWHRQHAGLKARNAER